MNKVLKKDFFLESSWCSVLKNELESNDFQKILAFLKAEKSKNLVIYPPESLIFNAFNRTPFSNVRVVIMGQDPYHGPGQAHGLCFSVNQGVKPPPSLQNIFKELRSDVQISNPEHGSLLSWANQGILLLNATLTVRANQPKSHYGQGWERFTDAVIMKIIEKKDPIIFVLWGKSAQEKCQHILSNQKSNHVILKASHPSPFSAYTGFLGCKHFSKINELLIKWNKKEINWNVL